MKLVVFSLFQKRFLKKIVTVFLFFLKLNFNAQGNTNENYSSADKQEIDTLSLQIENLVSLTNYYFEKNPDSMLYFQNLLLKKIEKVEGIEKQIKVYAKVIREEMLVGHNNLSKKLTPVIVRLCNQTKNYSILSKVYYYHGYYYQTHKSNTDSAATFYLKSLTLAMRENDKSMLANLNSAIGILYYNNSLCDSALRYINQSIIYHTQLKDSVNLLLDEFNLAAIYACKTDYFNAEKVFNQTLLKCRLQKNKIMELNAMFNLANLKNRSGKQIEAQEEVIHLIAKSKEYNQKNSILNAITLWAAIKFDLKEYKSAISKGEEALQMSIELASNEFISSNLNILISATKADGDFKKSVYYLEKKHKFDDSLATIKNTRYLEKLKGEYNLDLKNKELYEKTVLLEQNLQNNRNKNSIIWLLVALILILLILFYLYISRKRAKQLLEQQTVLQIEQQKEFSSFINGQESERKRIASDLHDGLAQNLVMLSLKVNSLKTESSVDNEKRIELKKDIDTLISETRSIAHNMMPDVLVELGLAKALKSMIYKLNEAHATLRVSLDHDERNFRLHRDLEIQVYRVIQELLNNTIKYAKASSCEIKFMSEGGNLNLLVKDNGIGFDSSLKQNFGIGLKSISARVTSLGGTIMINSTLGKGTETNIYLPLSNA